MKRSRVGILELLATREPGCCVFCGEPARLKSMRPSAVQKRRQQGHSDYFMTCGEPECRVVAFNRYYGRSRRAAEAAGEVFSLREEHHAPA